MGRNPDPLIERFRRECLPILRAQFAPQVVLAFGSRVRGDALEDSDLDLVVVSERFRGVRFIDRAVQVLEALNPSMAVELFCYTPEEFAAKQAELGIVSAAVREGVEL